MENKNDKQNKRIDVQDMFNIVRLDILNSMSMARKLGYVTAIAMNITTEKKLLNKNRDIKSLLNIRNQWQARVEILEQITASRDADKPAVGDTNDYSMLWDLAKPPVATVECYGQYYSSDDVKDFIKENAELKKENGKLETNIKIITEPIIAPFNIDKPTVKPAVKPAKEGNETNHSLIDDWEPLWDRARLDLTMRPRIKKIAESVKPSLPPTEQAPPPMPAVKPPIVIGHYVGTPPRAVVECDGQYYTGDSIKIFMKENRELEKENDKLKTNIETIIDRMRAIETDLDDANYGIESHVINGLIIDIRALNQFYSCIEGNVALSPTTDNTPDDGGD